MTRLKLILETRSDQETILSGNQHARIVRMSAKRRIFVQIPSYRDAQLIPTLKDMISNSAQPDELRIVVAWQHADDEELRDFADLGFEVITTDEKNRETVHHLRMNGATIELVDIEHLNSKGCGWARNLAQQRYLGEMYNLQIDAHHRFVSCWDERMIEMLESLRHAAEKPVLTGYPPAFDPSTDPIGRQDSVGAMVVRCFSSTGILSFRSTRIPHQDKLGSPIRARFMAGGFVFSDGHLVTNVMNDPEQFFSTEEIVMSARAYTHGYDFFHPHLPLLWHHYLNPAPKIWDDHTEEAKACGVIEETASSRTWSALQKSLRLLGVIKDEATADFGRFGLGEHRSLFEYERFAGFSLDKRAVRAEAMIPTEPNPWLDCLDGEDWSAGLVCPRTIRVRIEAPIRNTTRTSSLLVTSNTVDGRELSCHELTCEQLDKLFATGAVEYTEIVAHAIGKPPFRFSVFQSGDEEESRDFKITANEELT